MIRTLWVILLKEVRDLLRDRRALFFLFAPPILAPVGVVLVALFVGWQIASQAPQGFPVAVVGAAGVPELVARLSENSTLRLVDPPADPAAALLSGEVTAILTIPPDAQARIEAEQPVTLTLTTSRVGWMPALVDLAVRSVIDDYGADLLEQRLADHGLDREWVEPLRVQAGAAPTTGIVAPPAESASTDALSRSFNGLILPFLVASWTMGGGLGLIAYMTVGEKERGTMEPMLVTAASRVAIALGKIALSIVVSLITVVFWAIDGLAYLAVVNLSVAFPGPALALQQVQAYGVAGLWLFLLMLPLLVAVSGVTAAVCTFARNYREASLFMTVMQLGLPGLSFAATFVVPATPPAVVYALPFVGVLVAVRDLFLSGLPGGMLALAAATSLLYAALSIWLAAYVFSREWALMRGL